jgi:hypothetical protein
MDELRDNMLYVVDKIIFINTIMYKLNNFFILFFLKVVNL